MRTSRRAARRLVIVMAAVATSFAAATAVTEWRESAIAIHMRDIVQDALPSVIYLANARSQLRHVENIELLSPGTEAENAADLQRTRGEMATAFAQYRPLVRFPGEKEQYAKVQAELKSLDLALAGWRSTPRTGPALKEMLRQFRTVDRELERLIDINAEEGRRRGLAAERVRTQSFWLAIVLDGASVLLAGVATALAVRNLSRSVDAIEAKEHAATQRAVESEERASELEHFAGRVAHDLKNPLHALGLRLELLQRRSDGALKDSLSAAHHQLGRLNTVIDGLLEFARAGAHPQTGARAPVQPIVHELIQSVKETSGRVEIVATMPERPLEVAMSPGALTSVLANLLRNAAKYVNEVERADPKVEVRARTLGTVVRVEIEDNGPGIAEEFLESIFELHVRGATNLPGSGIGLATVKRIVEAHGGRVWVRSSVGAGSCFFAELPHALADSTRAEKPA